VLGLGSMEVVPASPDFMAFVIFLCFLWVVVEDIEAVVAVEAGASIEVLLAPYFLWADGVAVAAADAVEAVEAMELVPVALGVALMSCAKAAPSERIATATRAERSFFIGFSISPFSVVGSGPTGNDLIARLLPAR
jgi:hypothetical protein